MVEIAMDVVRVVQSTLGTIPEGDEAQVKISLSNHIRTTPHVGEGYRWGMTIEFMIVNPRVREFPIDDNTTESRAPIVDVHLA